MVEDNSKQPDEMDQDPDGLNVRLFDSKEQMEATQFLENIDEMLKDMGLSVDDPDAEICFDGWVNQHWEEDPLIGDLPKPTFRDFIAYASGLEDRPHPTLGLLPGIRIPNQSRNPAYFGPIPKVATGMRINLDTLQEGLTKGATFVATAGRTAQTAKNLLNSLRSPLARGSVTGVDDGDGGVSTFNYSGGSNYNPSGLSLASKPVDVKLNTDIGVTNFPRFYKDGGDETSPLILKSLVMAVPDMNDIGRVDFAVEDFFNGPITKDLISNISKRARYNSHIKSLVVPTKIKALINTMCFVLACQCCLDNIIAYQDNSNNRNKGMEVLYGGISPNDLLQLNTLRQELTKCLIPPTLYEFIHGLYAPYKQSHMPGSALMMLIPWSFQAVTTLPFTKLNDGMITAARNALNKDFILDWNALLSQTNDSWMNPMIRGYTGMPYIDPNYTTMFTNLQYRGWAQTASGNPTQVTLPQMVGQNSIWNFNFHTDAPDGGLLSLLTVYDTSNSGINTIGPGLGNTSYYTYTDDGAWEKTNDIASSHGPNKDRESTCLVYLGVGSGGVPGTQIGFYPCEYSNRTQALTANTYSLSSTGQVHAFQRFGATPADNTTKEGFRYTVTQFLEWLLYKDFANGGLNSRGTMTPRPKRNRDSWKDKKRNKKLDEVKSKEEL